jgi:transposase
MAEQKKSMEATVRSIRQATLKKYTAEEKVRIVLKGLRGESTIAELCRKEGIQPNLYYKWSKEFLEAGKQRLIGDTQHQADSQNNIWISSCRNSPKGNLVERLGVQMNNTLRQFLRDHR